MSSTTEFFLKATLVGVGGTIVLDLYALMMSRALFSDDAWDGNGLSRTPEPNVNGSRA
jgi:hypothetical protein